MERLRGFGDSQRLLVISACLAACTVQPAISARDAADANDTGQTVAVQNEAERLLLARLPALPNGKPQLIGNATVVAEAAYRAASGRVCRALQVTRERHHQNRLACSTGTGWFFVPDVFGGQTGTE